MFTIYDINPDVLYEKIDKKNDSFDRQFIELVSPYPASFLEIKGIDTFAARFYNNWNIEHLDKKNKRIICGKRKKHKEYWSKQILLAIKPYCAYCNEKIDFDTATIDHVIPLSRGGDRSQGNKVLCCLKCNSSKNDKLLDEWRPHLI